MITCQICNKQIKGFKGMAKHLSMHNLTPEEYTLKHIYNGEAPLCKCGCGEKTNYKRKEYRFNDFIHNHHRPTHGQKVHTKKSLEAAKAKRRETLLEKYNTDNVMKIKEIRDKFSERCVEKYGVKWTSYLPQVKDGAIEKNKLSYDDFLNVCDKKKYEPLFLYEQYEGCRIKYPFRCKKHNVIFSTDLFLVSQENVNQCPKCKINGTSKGEMELAEFVRSVCSVCGENDVISNTRDIISPYELDVFVPNRNIAVEYNGLYWHSEIRKHNKYHIEKFEACLNKGIQLIQIYEDEWRERKEICQSIIRNKLGVCFRKIGARKTTVHINVPVKEIKPFIDNNHLQGYVRAKSNFVLKDKDGEIVFCVTLRHPFTKDKDKTTIEIARICSKNNVLVMGGFTKLLKHVINWCRENGYKTLLTYSDCRYSYGDVYKNNGFEYVRHTGLGYGYTDFVNRFNRFRFRAQPNKTEKQVALENNVYKIYNAGNYSWKMDIE